MYLYVMSAIRALQPFRVFLFQHLRRIMRRGVLFSWIVGTDICLNFRRRVNHGNNDGEMPQANLLRRCTLPLQCVSTFSDLQDLHGRRSCIQ